MMQVLVFVLLVTAMALAWRFAARKNKQRAELVARHGTHKTYHCVEVHKGYPACKAVEDLGTVRFLSDEAPSLPLSGCTEKKCTCAYIHHDDRRDDDRRHPYGQFVNLPPTISGERRSRTDRRKSGSSFKPSMAR
jgi:hypothetical protein